MTPRPIKVDIVFQYNDSITDQILCFTNTITNPDGGTHLAGFRSALTRAINQYGKTNNLFKPKDPALSGDDVREGLVAVISLLHPDPKFESQTKVKLLSPEVEGIVSSATYESLMSFFDGNPEHRQAHHRQGAQRRPRQRSGPPRPRGRAQDRALRRRPARQAGRLLQPQSRGFRALHRRG